MKNKTSLQTTEQCSTEVMWVAVLNSFYMVTRYRRGGGIHFCHKLETNVFVSFVEFFQVSMYLEDR